MALIAPQQLFYLFIHHRGARSMFWRPLLSLLVLLCVFFCSDISTVIKLMVIKSEMNQMLNHSEALSQWKQEFNAISTSWKQVITVNL